MKETDAKIDYDKHQLLLYVEKSDGQYGSLQTGSYLTKNYVDDFWEKRKKIEHECLENLKNGKISPIKYHMILNDISAADLASRAGLSVSKVKKHCDPKFFCKLNLIVLQKYASVFGIDIVDMLQIMAKPVNSSLKLTRAKTAIQSVVIAEIVEAKE